MKIKNRLLTIAMALAIASAGQSMAGEDIAMMSTSYGPPRTGPAVGTIIVYRPWSFRGSIITNWRFNGTYYRLTVLAGDSILSHDNMPFLEEDPQRVNVQPGQTVYFQYMMSWGLIFEEAEDQQRAAMTASTLVPMN
jgi:hypothetical protein